MAFSSGQRSPRGALTSRARREELWDYYQDFEGPITLGHGKFKVTRIYHGVLTTADRTGTSSHIQNLKDKFPEIQGAYRCRINENFDGEKAQKGTQCTKPATIGAHVYFNNNEYATAKICQIIPTCSRHNSFRGNEKRHQNWPNDPRAVGDSGVEVVNNTPFLLRFMKFQPCEDRGKGSGGKGTGKGTVMRPPAVENIMDCVSGDIKYDDDTQKAIAKAFGVIL